MLTTEELNEINSLTEIVKKDHQRIEELFKVFVRNVIKEDPETLSASYETIKEICSKEEHKNELLKGMRLLAEAIYDYYQSRFIIVIEKTNEAIRIFEKYKRPVNVGMAYMINGGSYRSLGEIDESVKRLYKSLELLEGEDNNKIFLTYSYYHLAEIFNFIKDYDAAKDSYEKGVKYAELSNNYNGLFRTYNGLGCMNLKLGEFNKAKFFLEKSMVVNEMSDAQKSRGLCDLGTYYLKTNDFEKSRELLLESYDIRIACNMIDASSTCLIELGKLELKVGNISTSIEYLEKALDIVLELKSKSKEVNCYYYLAQAYSENGQNEEAVNAFKEYDILQRQFQSITIQNIYKIKNQKIEEQKTVIEKALSGIRSSITYAKRIQKAILPVNELIKKHLPDSYIYYRPKDIVAGDFYWFEVVKNNVLFAVADCTGHGVPGALVSVVCHNALNRAVREFKLEKPGEILDKVNEIVQDSLSKSEGTEVKDGMDIALCSYDPEGKIIQFAGANNPLYIISRDENSFLERFADKRPIGKYKSELYEVKGTRQPIGKFELNVPFENHTIQLRNGDEVIMSSDGFPDQFGGEENKKLMYRPFKTLLMSLNDEKIENRKEKLNEFFTDWKKNYDQTDDVCVFGVKIN